MFANPSTAKNTYWKIKFGSDRNSEIPCFNFGIKDQISVCEKFMQDRMIHGLQQFTAFKFYFAFCYFFAGYPDVGWKVVFMFHSMHVIKYYGSCL